MTDDQSQKLDFIYNLLIAGALQNPPHDLLAQMQAGFGKVLAVPAGAGGLTAAQAAQLTAMAGDLETIRQRIEKDLAP